MAFVMTCSVCASVHAAAIAAELAKRTPLKTIQQKYGIHKSSLSRHSRKCLNRKRENKFVAGRRIPLSQCKQVVWFASDGPVPDNLRRDDTVILRVNFEPLQDYYGLLDEHGRYLIADQAHTPALLENEQRNQSATLDISKLPS